MRAGAPQSGLYNAITGGSIGGTDKIFTRTVASTGKSREQIGKSLRSFSSIEEQRSYSLIN